MYKVTHFHRGSEKAILKVVFVVTHRMKETFVGEGEGRMLQAAVMPAQPERHSSRKPKHSARESGKMAWGGHRRQRSL